MSEMPIYHERLSELKQLCRLSIEAGITKLCEVGAWPRPPAARKLRAGYDFYYKDLEDIQEVNNLIQYLASDDKIKSIYFEESSTAESWVLYWFWQRLFLNILRETEGTIPNNVVFKGWFKKFIKELYSDTAVWRTIDTVTGLDFRVPTLRLDDVTTLTSIHGYNLEALVGGQELDLLDFSGGSPGGHDTATIITTVRIPKQKYIGSTHPYSHLIGDIERSNSLIEAIRLTKSGSPRLHCHIMIHLSNFPLDEPFAYCKSEMTLGSYEKEAIVERRDFQKIKNLWREIMETGGRDPIPKRFRIGAMNIALGRFYKSFELQSWLEDIVDLTIALESLFKPKDSNQELKYRIAMRAAWLLGVDKKDNEDSARVYNRVRAMYDIRSSTVHGGTPDESKIGKWLEELSDNTYDDSSESYRKLVEPAVESARDIVRRALRACMRLSTLGVDGPHWPFPPKFDENIVIANQRKVWQKAAGVKNK